MSTSKPALNIDPLRLWQTQAAIRYRRDVWHVRKGNAVLMSDYLGSIGFGFPAAMGA